MTTTTSKLHPSYTLPIICGMARPHATGNERNFRRWLRQQLDKLEHPYQEDQAGNIWAEVGQDNDVLFCAHIDTVDRQKAPPKKHLLVENGQLKLNKEIYPSKKALHTCLGADDGVGIAINLYLMEQGIAGTFLFTRGEEQGCLGADWIARNLPDKLRQYKCCIEVDRAGTWEIITHQSTGRCASTKFAEQLAEELGMDHEPSDRGAFTDNAHFNGLIPECVNIAAGYYHQHSPAEYVKLDYVFRLADALLTVDYGALAAVRDPDDDFMEDNWDFIDFISTNPEAVALYLQTKGVTRWEIEEMSAEYGVYVW